MKDHLSPKKDTISKELNDLPEQTEECTQVTILHQYPS
jgi:hypothetical protein